jgi:hypothetical protein
VLALDIDGLAGEQVTVDVEELAGDGVTLVMIKEDAIALVLDGIAAGDDVDEQPAMRAATAGDCRPGRTATR